MWRNAFDTKLLTKVGKTGIVKLFSAVSHNGMRYPKPAYDEFSYEVNGSLFGNLNERFYFDLLSEVIDCNNGNLAPLLSICIGPIRSTSHSTKGQWATTKLSSCCGALMIERSIGTCCTSSQTREHLISLWARSILDVQFCGLTTIHQSDFCTCLHAPLVERIVLLLHLNTLTKGCVPLFIEYIIN